MGSRLNYLDTQSSTQHRQIHSHTKSQTHTLGLFGILYCLSHFAFEQISLPLCSVYLPLDRFSLFFILIFPFFLRFSHLNNNFLCARCGSLPYLAPVICSNRVVLIYSLHTLSSVVIPSCAFSITMSFPSSLSAKRSLDLIRSCCTSSDCTMIPSVLLSRSPRH